MLFLSFGICSICILALILTHITIPYNKVLRWWNQNGYTIYLWQNITFFVVSILLINLPDFFISGVIGFIFKSLSVFIIATALSIIAVPYENFFIKKTSLLFNQIVIYCKSFLSPVK